MMVALHVKAGEKIIPLNRSLGVRLSAIPGPHGALAPGTNGPERQIPRRQETDGRGRFSRLKSLISNFLDWLEGKLDKLYDWFYGEDEETETPEEEEEEKRSLWGSVDADGD